MKLIDQHAKAIMEECKVQARDAGLEFDDETLEYIVTNRDMLELSPKVMIPSLYDYWVHDVEVLKSYGKYKLYPSNPYETVINSRPAISFYNDNNPDWLNVMIFYHVLGHIDFFQNNALFEKTWNDDFVGQALADKRLIANLRSEHGRWVDYIIEFSRSIDNITGYFDSLAQHNFPENQVPSEMIDFYFNDFLQEIVKLPGHKIYNEVRIFNDYQKNNPDLAETIFISEIKRKYPEFEAKFNKYNEKPKEEKVDLLEYIRNNSPFLRRDENQWIKSVMSIIRNTAQYFAPQVRTKIINEGWASYWHDTLFRGDHRISGHQSAYAKINAGVTSISRVGLNPYAIGLRLIQYIEELADKGKLDWRYSLIYNIEKRDEYDKNTGKGQETIFKLRENFSDFMLINTFIDQDFVDRHKLFVVGQRLNPQTQMIEYYVKSRKAADYKKMIIDSMYHPPVIEIVESKTNDDNLYLRHRFEGKQLIKNFIPGVLIGLEFLWGEQVQLETTEIVVNKPQRQGEKPSFTNRPVLYSIKNKKVSKKNL